jgi:hypothetical protein
MRTLPRILPARYSCCLLLLTAALLSILVSSFRAQTSPPPGPNADPIYQALRNITLGTESVSVSDVKFRRDAGTFVLHSGTVCFVPPVNGKVTGAVFIGDGKFVLDAPNEAERKSLRLLSKNDEAEFAEQFGRLVLRFTDDTYDELKKAGKPAIGSCDNGPLKDSQYTTRHKLKQNLEVRLLQEVLSPNPRPYFIAFIHGKRYEDKEIFEVEPNQDVEQISFVTYNENRSGEWASFSYTQPQTAGSFGRTLHIDHQQLDTTFEKSGHLNAKATATFVARRDGLRVVPFDLFRPLRVQNVAADNQPLSFIQEDKNDDGDFAVILAKPLKAGDTFSVTTTYAGKDAVSNEGGGNYYPIARHNWYPNDADFSLGSYASYDMTFRIPKGMKMAATGVQVSESNEGGQNVTVWKSETPQTVAGFSFGRFKMEQGKLDKPEYLVQSYANEESPDWVRSLKQYAEGGDLPTQGEIGHSPQMALGSMSTTSLNKKALAEGELAVQLYSDYFGASSFKHMQLTQQTACNYGQSWPELVWIPICYYFDITVRHQLGVDFGDKGYWKVVTPHEVAHQWWGHTIGFASGRDQWMSEGFSDFSASLYLSFIEKNTKKFLTFWNDERELLLERDAQGFRAIDAGPLTMGYRASNSRTGWGITRRLIYPKGAYILHMIRMMMFDTKTGDQRFKETMHDFVDSYRGKAATTEDFKGIVEKHMTPEMDLEGNHKMNWFFNEYVYGTQIPSYKLESSVDGAPDGTSSLRLKLSQSNVDATFHMLVPVYLELEDGRIVLLGRARFITTNSFDQKVPLGKTKVRRALINYYDDVLASP